MSSPLPSPSPATHTLLQLTLITGHYALHSSACSLTPMHTGGTYCLLMSHITCSLNNNSNPKAPTNAEVYQCADIALPLVMSISPKMQ